MLEQLNYIRTQAMPKGYIYTIRIDRPITDPDEFQEELATLRQAGPADDVHILINSGGGSIDTAKAFLTAMVQSEAHIIAEIEGTCCSAATLLFLAATEQRVGDDAEFMIHTASFGYGGKANNVKEYVDFTAKSTERLLNKYYYGFLTEEEINEALKGKDFWMDADEIMERLEKRAGIFEADMAKQEEADAEEQQAMIAELFGLPEEIPREKLMKMTRKEIIDHFMGEEEEEETEE